MPSIPAPPRAPTYGQGDTVLDLIMQQGQNRAAAADRSGAIWGNAFANIGNTLAGGIQQYGEQQAVKKRTAALDALFGGPEPPSLGSLVKILGPKDGVEAFKGLRATMPDASKLYGDRMEQARDVARGVQALPEERRAAAYQYARQQLVASGAFKPEEAPEEFNPDFITQLASYGKEPAKAEGLQEVSPNASLYDPATKKAVFTAPAAPAAAPNLQHVETAEGIRSFNPQTGALGPVIARGRPASGGEAPSLQRVETDAGIQTFNPRTGQLGPVIAKPPAPARASRPPTGAERTALGFYNRAEQAFKDADAVADKVGSGLGDQARLAYDGPGSNFVKSDAQQQYRQAQRAFTEARLRKDSGANIPDHEYDKDSLTYFKQPGDSAAVIAQKDAARKVALDSMMLQSGKAYEEYYGEQAPTPRNQAAAGGTAPPPPGSGGAAAAGAPVPVSSPAEAARLPRGTPILLPDGSVGRVP